MKANAIIQVWDLMIKELKWLSFNDPNGYPESDYTAANLVSDDYTNFNKLKAQFMPSDWTITVPNNSDFVTTKEDSDATMKITFKITVTKDSDSHTGENYEIKSPIKAGSSSK